MESDRTSQSHSAGKVHSDGYHYEPTPWYESQSHSAGKVHSDIIAVAVPCSYPGSQSHSAGKVHSDAITGVTMLPSWVSIPFSGEGPFGRCFRIVSSQLKVSIPFSGEGPFGRRRSTNRGHVFVSIPFSGEGPFGQGIRDFVVAGDGSQSHSAGKVHSDGENQQRRRKLRVSIPFSGEGPFGPLGIPIRRKMLSLNPIQRGRSIRTLRRPRRRRGSCVSIPFSGEGPFGRKRMTLRSFKSKSQSHSAGKVHSDQIGGHKDPAYSLNPIQRGRSIRTKGLEKSPLAQSLNPIQRGRSIRTGGQTVAIPLSKSQSHSAGKVHSDA